jgi:pimeloyl-ACP methyl ester carboxylesterase
MKMQQLQYADANGTSLAYEEQGSGEAVVFLHCGLVADSFAQLLDQPALADHYRLISYHRRGYGGSARETEPMTFTDMASDCRALLKMLGVERAHVVGHSFGADVAIQLALDAPALVHSLALLEPPLPGVPTDPAAIQYFMGTIMAAVERYAAGDKAGAVDTWLRGAFQPDYRRVIDQALPGWFDQAAADADVVFQVELPALQQWSFTPADAAGITQLVLSVTHDDRLWSGFQEAHERLLAMLSQVESFVVRDATHLLQIMRPQEVADALAGFFARHPMRSTGLTGP